MNLTGRACPKCSRLMKRQEGSTRKVNVFSGFFIETDVCEICPVCRYELPLHLHMYSNNVAVGQRLMLMGQYREAEKLLLETHRSYPALDSAYVLALLYSKTKDRTRAMTWFKKGMGLFGQWPTEDISTRQDFLIDYAFFLGFELGQYDLAINILQQAISIYEQNYKAYYNLGSLYVRSEIGRAHV